MRRFTVSLPDDLYTDLRARCEESVPPASLQQMVRYAVESLLVAEQPEVHDVDVDQTTEPADREVGATDLLVFQVGEAAFGIPIGLVETVAAGIDIHPIPSSSASLVGVVPFRGGIAEVHDGAAVLIGAAGAEDAGSLLAVSRNGSRALLTVSTVEGLVKASALQWGPAPASAPPHIVALAWDDRRVIAVADPRRFDLD